MSARPTFNSVQEYLAALEPTQRKVLKAVLAVVRRTAPEAEAVISYGIPAFKSGRVFIYCAAFKHHIGIYPPVSTDDAKLGKALRTYSNAKGSLSFPLDEPMPLPLIARVTKALAKQNALSKVTGPKHKSAKKGTGLRTAG